MEFCSKRSAACRAAEGVGGIDPAGECAGGLARVSRIPDGAGFGLRIVERSRGLANSTRIACA